MSKDPDELDEDLGPQEDEPKDEEPEEPEEPAPPIVSKKPAASPKIASKTPVKKVGGGKDISVYFQSTIGPGEKKQKLLINTGNNVSAIKRTVGKMFGLDPADFNLSHGGVTLDESSPMSDYNVKDGDTLLLIPESTAGTA
nr:ubiquitin-like domain-containing protein [Candidatus Sigynarchaeota archaeon]